MRPLAHFTLLVFCLALLAGCGQSIVPIKGKVMFEGKPVTAGSVTFQLDVPEDQMYAGRPSSGEVQPDGSFQLTTNSPNDGAPLGRHRVVYIAPFAEEGSDPKLLKAAKMYGNLEVPKDFIAEVKGGGEEIIIELRPKPKDPFQQGPDV
jgi:hypothetical protein